MFSNITTPAIIKNQWKNLLKHFSSGKIIWKNVFLYALLPIVLGILYGYFSYNKDRISDIFLFSILTGIIVIIGTIILNQVIIGTAKMNNNSKAYTEIEHLLGNYLQTNVSYVLIVSFITMLLIITYITVLPISTIITAILSSSIVALIMNMLLIMLVIFKQIRAMYKIVYIP